jgi:hypothetical protein
MGGIVIAVLFLAMDPQAAPFAGLYDAVDLRAVDRTDFGKHGSDIPDFDDAAGLVAGILAAADGRPIGELEIMDHAGPGQLQLGDERVFPYSLAGSPLAELAGHFGPEGHIDLHACELAAGASGEAFLRQMVAVTGVPVSAGLEPQSVARGFEGPVMTCAPAGDEITCSVDEPTGLAALVDHAIMAFTRR